MRVPDDPYRYQEVLVSPMYLAGSDGTGDAGFAPVAHWPHHYLDEGPCQLVVTSPDQRIRIGWFGDDFELWKITAAAEAVSAPRWTATFNHATPAEIVAGLTTALAHDYTESDAYDGNGRFLAGPSNYWADVVRPLTDAGWRREAGERGTVEIVAPDGQAGVLIDNRLSGWDDETVTLWAGPPGWGTRAEAVFTARTPSHLIAATAAVMAESAPSNPRTAPDQPQDGAPGHADPGRPHRRSPAPSRSNPTRRSPQRCRPGRPPRRAHRAHRSRPPGDGRPQPHRRCGAEPVRQLRDRRRNHAVGHLVGSTAQPLIPGPGLPGHHLGPKPRPRTTGVPSCPPPPRSTRPQP